MQQPEPEFAVGQPVRVLVNERNRTPHTGVVRRTVWHFKFARWTYFLEENGKRVAKRHFADDLVAELPSVTEPPSLPT